MVQTPLPPLKKGEHKHIYIGERGRFNYSAGRAMWPSPSIHQSTYRITLGRGNRGGKIIDPLPLPRQGYPSRCHKMNGVISFQEADKETKHKN